MKFNKWTVGLAAAGIVTLPSLAQAAAPSMVQTLTENTTLSGYVDTSAQWNSGNGNANNPPIAFNGEGKADGFNLNVVDIALDKPLDETPWASGYHAELWFGPDATTLGTDSRYGSASSNVAIRQAYVTLRTPIGNGIDWKIGVFDTIIGYESTSSPNNPNFTHSYGYSMEPTTHEGLVGTYKICDAASFTAGVANTFGPQIGSRAHDPTSGSVTEQNKTWMTALTLTAPQSWGWLAGSSMSAGVICGFNNGISDTAGGKGANQTSVYVGATLSTPITGLKGGASLDYSHIHDNSSVTFGEGSGDNWDIALYASYQATEKLSFNGRVEYLITDSELLDDPFDSDAFDHNKVWATTLTAQYDLWKNVLSRVEFRWDHTEHFRPFGNGNQGDAFMLAANVIYKF
jgi:Putative beta-barrel porin-2, OmpL-like. bbp2